MTRVPEHGHALAATVIRTVAVVLSLGIVAPENERLAPFGGFPLGDEFYSACVIGARDHDCDVATLSQPRV
ncbi:MAG: hypothetical protein ACRENH_06255 [Gemmatimonadaceae bacterium]